MAVHVGDRIVFVSGGRLTYREFGVTSSGHLAGLRGAVINIVDDRGEMRYQIELERPGGVFPPLHDGVVADKEAFKVISVVDVLAEV